LAARVRALFTPDLGTRVRAFIEDKTARFERGLLMRGPEEITHGAFAGLAITADEIRGSAVRSYAHPPSSGWQMRSPHIMRRSPRRSRRRARGGRETTQDGYEMRTDQPQLTVSGLSRSDELDLLDHLPPGAAEVHAQELPPGELGEPRVP
jgi:hypothetical protein